MGFILKFILTAILAFVLTKFLPGAHLDGITDALLLVLVLGILNAIVKPILKFLGLPITILTLGLFLLVINAVIVLLADWLLAGFKVDGFLSALIYSIALTILTAILDMIFD